MEISYQKLIHDYLDGALGEDEERRLFDQLSANPEWREELNFQMKMHGAMQKDLAGVPIPQQATASVFSALGFGIPQKAAAMLGSGLGLGKMILGVASVGIIAVASWIIVGNFSKTEVIHEIPNHSENNISPVSPLTPIGPISPSIVPKNSLSVKSPRDIGKFSSIDYLSKNKVIGITSGGNIYLSDDGGSLWEAERSNTSKDLYGMHFADQHHGVIVGAQGTILLTANGGKEWAAITSGTEANLIAVRFVSHDTLFACGAQGTVLRSTTGGLLWQKMESGITASLYKIKFENGLKGTIAGEGNIVLQTNDGGRTWIRN